MVKLDRVSFSYGGAPVLKDVSLTLPKSGAICLFGPSGCGKTTLLRLIAGLEAPTDGTIHRKASRVAMVFQENRLVPWLTVRENLLLVTDDGDAVEKALAAVSLQDVANELPDALSGGMQRRVALARALAFGGDLLLLDEPFNGLDDGLKVTVAAALRERFAECPIVMVTHSLDEAALFDATVITL
ncbi:MAG: ABC transporter ATP-binding protein [Clostridia bacterium]|nr:ABC transporter ATP-binding protein [Clostridia bacterium]